MHWNILQEEGPTIHELAHDDVMHNDVQDPVTTPAFVNNTSPGSNAVSGLTSGIDPSMVQYQVTLEGDESSELGISNSLLCLK